MRQAQVFPLIARLGLHIRPRFLKLVAPASLSCHEQLSAQASKGAVNPDLDASHPIAHSTSVCDRKAWGRVPPYPLKIQAMLSYPRLWGALFRFPSLAYGILAVRGACSKPRYALVAADGMHPDCLI